MTEKQCRMRFMGSKNDNYLYIMMMIVIITIWLNVNLMKKPAHEIIMVNEPVSDLIKP